MGSPRGRMYEAKISADVGVGGAKTASAGSGLSPVNAHSLEACNKASRSLRLRPRAYLRGRPRRLGAMCYKSAPSAEDAQEFLEESDAESDNTADTEMQLAPRKLLRE